MAKQGLTIKEIKTPILKDRSAKTGWSLCIGAGASYPVFPSWEELVFNLINRDIDSDLAEEIKISLLGKFSPDAIIQAASNKFGVSDEEFADILRNELYKNVEAKLNKKEWGIFNKVFFAKPNDLSQMESELFLSLINSHYPKLTSYALGKLIIQLHATECAPKSILSFNAEPLLSMLINSISRSKGNKKMILDLMTQSFIEPNPKHIPYYFCHGVFPSPNQRKPKKRLQSIDKLVFSESKYLSLSNSSYNWHSSVFLRTCSTNSVVFIGVSLSDPNMRQWLSWIYENRMNELRSMKLLKDNNSSSTSHLWINKAPKTPKEKRWIEATVEHLGIRLIWIDSWDQVGLVLNKLLGLK